MSDYKAMQASYTAGDYTKMVETAEDEEHISVHYLLDQISGRIRALAEHLAPDNENIDPENYAAFKKLAEINQGLVNQPCRDQFDPGYRIEIPEEIFAQAGRWNKGAVPADALALIKERVAAFNDGNVYLVHYHEVPIEEECYFANHREIADHLAGTFMLTRNNNEAASEKSCLRLALRAAAAGINLVKESAAKIIIKRVESRPNFIIVSDKRSPRAGLQQFPAHTYRQRPRAYLSCNINPRGVPHDIPRHAFPPRHQPDKPLHTSRKICI